MFATTIASMDLQEHSFTEVHKHNTDKFCYESSPDYREWLRLEHYKRPPTLPFEIMHTQKESAVLRIGVIQ